MSMINYFQVICTTSFPKNEIVHLLFITQGDNASIGFQNNWFL